MGATPRSFHVPKALRSASFGPTVTLDEIEPVALQKGPAAEWAAKLLATENHKTLDDLLGEDTRLPRGVLADDADEGDEIVVGLVNHRGEVWDLASNTWRPVAASIGNTVDLDDADVAFIARALREGADCVTMRPFIPLAFISAAAPGAPPQDAVKVMDLPNQAVVVAIVDSLDKEAVLEMLAVAPGPKVYRRHDGSWMEDPEWKGVLASVKPPTMVKLTPEQIASVTTQVDQATSGQPFEPFKDSMRGMYQPVTSSACVQELQHEAEQRGIDINMALVAVAGRELSPKDMASTERLKRYWTVGKGAAKIRWGTPGAWRRCHRHMLKYVGPRVAPGLCTNMAKRLGGHGVATHVLEH